jgi:hypothetical protein
MLALRFETWSTLAHVESMSDAEAAALAVAMIRGARSSSR